MLCTCASWSLCLRLLAFFQALQCFPYAETTGLLSGLPAIQSTSLTKSSLCSFIFSLVMCSSIASFSNSKTTLWWPPGKMLPMFFVQPMISFHSLPKRPRDKIGFAPIPFSQLTKAFFQALNFLLLPSLLGLLCLQAFFQAWSFLLPPSLLRLLWLLAFFQALSFLLWSFLPDVFLLVFSLNFAFVSLCLQVSLQWLAFFQAFAFLQIPRQLLLQPFPIDLCS